MKHRDVFDEYKARNRSSKKTVLLVKIQNGLDVDEIESLFSQLKECDYNCLARYANAIKKKNEFWVVLPFRVDRID